MIVWFFCFWIFGNFCNLGDFGNVCFLNVMLGIYLKQTKLTIVGVWGIWDKCWECLLCWGNSGASWNILEHFEDAQQGCPPDRSHGSPAERLQSCPPPQTLQVSNTWAREFHDLLDFESDHVESTMFSVRGSTTIIRNARAVATRGEGVVPPEADSLLRIVERGGNFWAAPSGQRWARLGGPQRRRRRP